MNTDFLCDLLIELDQRYRSIHLSHTEGGVYLDSLGSAGFELLAGVIPTVNSPVLKMHTSPDDCHLVSLSLQANDAGLWDVRMEAGSKTDELNVSDILGELKGIYS